MAKPLVVVDTNVFRSATDDDVARLADLATLRLSDVALAEVWARSVHEYRKHGCRRKARGLFFTPLRRWFRHLDEHQRVAPVARQAVDAVERAVAQVDEPAEVADLRERANRWVASMVYPELTDEEWLEGGEELAAYLDKQDDEWRTFCLPEHAIWTARYPDEAERETARAAWRAGDPTEQRRTLLTYYGDCLAWSPLVRQRLDLYLRVQCWRLLNASHRHGVARENDGADALTLVHVGTGAILATDDKRVLSAVVASGSSHGAWVRGLAEVLSQPLPTCAPWEPGADDVRARFLRSTIDVGELANVMWPTDL